MRNLVQLTSDAFDQLGQLEAAASDPDEVNQAADRIEECLRWYDPVSDPDLTDGCGPVDGPGLLPAPHYTARAITVPPLRAYFEVDDQARPFIMTIVRYQWTPSVFDPGQP
jgi:hypothetical protein